MKVGVSIVLIVRFSLWLMISNIPVGNSCATIELGGTTLIKKGDIQTGGKILQDKLGLPLYRLDFPVGVKACDKFFEVLEELSGKKTPEKYMKQKGRLIDSYVDGHKYVFGKKAVVYGDEDFVIGITGMLKEIGIVPVLCASGGYTGEFKKRIQEITGNDEIYIEDDTDFENIRDICTSLKPDLLIGSSKGYYIARELDVPIVRLGFPIHDRMSGQRIPHLTY
jgi:nitrogenase molybdenum-iron protein NifN